MHIESRHLGLKKYQCDVCEFATAYAQHLRNHKEAKHEGKRYNCDLCTSTFSLKSNLDNHKKTLHGDSKVFACDQCEYTALQFYSLKLHKESRHEKIRHTCDLCEFSAARKGDLSRHMKIKHEVKQ